VWSEAGLLAYGPISRAFPAGWAPASGRFAAADVPDHSGGTAPDSHRLPIATDLECEDRTAAAGSGAPPRLSFVTVNLTRIYTRLGDGGETHLGDMSRVPKTDPRIEAYGTVDELNSQLGLALTVEGLDEQHAEWLRHVQNDLFDVGADIAAPEDPDRERLRVLPDQTVWLEERCDEVNATLAPLKSFVLPGGTAPAAHLHVCRTVCRRAERLAIACGDQCSPEVVRYLNRLSDLLFILARAANAGEEPLWEPGRFR
jgi:cob(I)alamin adenosyltransferase